METNLEKEIVLTDNGKELLSYWQTHDSVYVGKDLTELTGIKGIYSVINSLMRNGLVEEDEPITRPFTNSKGVTSDKIYKTYKMTDAGRKFVINN